MKTFIASEHTALIQTEIYHNRQKVVSRSIAFMKRLPEN